MRRSVDRKPVLLVTAEVNGGSGSSVHEGDGSEVDQGAMTVVEEAQLHRAYSPADVRGSTRIGNETHEDLPATGK